MMKRGDKGAQVKALQQQLLDIGYVLPRFGADGSLGAETISAATQFAIERRMVPVPANDGSYDPSKHGYPTWAALQAGTIPDTVVSAITQASPWIRGIDVSAAQGDKVDWAAVKDSGIRYAWARATVGKTTKDKCFAKNWAAMKAAGIPRGAYHVFNPQRSGVDNLANYKATVGPLDHGDLYPMIDVEGEDIYQEANQNLYATIDAFTAEYKVPPVIYSSERIYGLWKLTAGKGCAYWGAYYVLNVNHPPVPKPFADWAIWQSGYGEGINGVGLVDRDLLQGGEPALEALRVGFTSHLP